MRLIIFGLFVATSFAQSHVIPEFSYRYTSFASASPAEAANFMIQYIGGSRLDAEDFLLHGNTTVADIQGVRWCYSNVDDGNQSCHDVYFIADPTKPAGARPVAEYERYLHHLHSFDIQETWDWYQDNHLCFHVDNVDTILYRLIRDEIPVVTRSDFSFYVEIPHGITLQILGSSMELLWTENFNFCRYTNGKGIVAGDPRQPLQLKALPDEEPTFPEIRPSHMSFFSTKPFEAFNFTLAHSSATPYNMSEAFRNTHRYGDGECAQLAWLQFGGEDDDDTSDVTDDGNSSPLFQIHFIQQYHKHDGPQSVAKTESFLEQLHADMTSLDAYMDYRVGFSVANLTAYAEHLTNNNVPFLPLNCDGSVFYPSTKGYWNPPGNKAISLLYEIPGGIIFEVFTEENLE